ncbi:MAG: hypothetical protein C0506_13400 [Anaerolinea sp.]|nr:hypothetical protein [Anaerolinea sp.]
MSEPGGAEPTYTPYLRFARNVLLVDLVMGAMVFGLSWKQGWTSLEESTTAIFGGGAVLLAIAILPIAGPMLNSASPTTLPGGMTDYSRYRAMAAGYEEPHLMHPRATLTLLVAGFIPIAYAGVVSVLFSS